LKKSRPTHADLIKKFTHVTYALGFTVTEEDLMNDADRLPGWMEWRQADDMMQHLTFWTAHIGWAKALARTLREFGPREAKNG